MMSMSSNADIEIRPTAGLPQEESIYLRVTPQYAEDLESSLREAGVPAGIVLEFSATTELVAVMVQLASAGVTVGSVIAGLRVFFHRHDGKKVKFGNLELTGFSSKQIEKLLNDAVTGWEANNE